MEKNKTLYLHIGIEKTGTSAIQYHLYANRELLKNHDIYYPETGLWHDKSHHGFAFALFEIGAWGVNQPKEAMLKDLIDEYHASDCNNIIISSEILRSFYKNKNAKWFFEEIKAVVNEIKIIVYLRRQDKWLASLYNQNIKDPVTKYSNSFESFVEKMHDEGDYSKLIEGWGTILNKEDLIIKLYNDKKVDNRQFVADFIYDLTQSEAVFESFLWRDDPVNLSLNDFQLELIRYLNEYKSLSLEQRRDINNFIVQKFRLEESSKLPPIQHISQNILDRYKESNSRLASDLGLSELW